MIPFDTDYPYPMVYPKFCYQKSITPELSQVILDVAVQVAWMYYSIFFADFPDSILVLLKKSIT